MNCVLLFLDSFFAVLVIVALQVLPLLPLLLLSTSAGTTADAFYLPNKSIRPRYTIQRQQQQQQQKALIPSSTISFVDVTTNNKKGDYFFFLRRRSSSSSSLFAVRSNTAEIDDSSDDNDDNNDFDTQGEKNRQWLIETYGLTKEQLTIKLEGYRYNATPTSTLIYRANSLQQRLGLTNKEMKKIIKNWPKLLMMKYDTNVEPTLDLMEKIFGKKSLKALVLKDPRVLGSRKEDIEPKLDYIQNRLKLDTAKLNKIIKKCPPVLTCSVEEKIQPTVDWLQHKLNLTDSGIGNLVAKFPHILLYSLEGNIQPTIDWCQQELNLTNDQVAKIICRLPQILGMSVTSNLEPKLEWLRNRYDLTDKQISGIVRKCPGVFACTTDTIEEKLEWIKKRLDLTDEQVSRIFARWPGILSRTADNIEPKLEWLQERLTLTDAGLSTLIASQPQILGLDITKNLEPKLDFYIEAIMDEQTAIAIVTNNPAFLTASLKNKLQPRLIEAREANLTIDGPCLVRIAKYTPKQWSTSIDFQTRKLRTKRIKDELW